MSVRRHLARCAVVVAVLFLGCREDPNAPAELSQVTTGKPAGHPGFGVDNPPLDGVPFAVAVNDKGVYYVSQLISGGVVRGALPSQDMSARVQVGSITSQVRMSPDGRTAFANNQDEGTIKVIDVMTNTIITTIAGTPSILTSGISPNGRTLYALSDFHGIDIFNIRDPRHPSFTGNIPQSSTGSILVGIAFHPSQPLMYVTARDEGRINVINTTTNAVVSTIVVAGARIQSVAVTRDGTQLFATDIERSKLLVWSTSNLSAPPQEVAVGTPNSRNAFDVALTPDQVQVYVSTLSDGLIFVFDRASLNLVTSLNVGGSPRYIGFNSAGTYAVVPNEFGYVSFVYEGGAPPPPPPPPPNQPPVADFSFACSNLACTFTSTSSDPDGTVASYNWNFGDGGSSNAQNPSHTYSAGGTYTVTLTVTDNQGAPSAPNAKPVTVSPPNQPPVADFSFACSYLACDFTSTSSDPDGTVASYSWDFGDGGSSNAQNPSHTYSAANTYTVTLTVTDNQGAPSAPTSKIVMVTAPPVSCMTPPTGTPPAGLSHPTLSLLETSALSGLPFGVAVSKDSVAYITQLLAASAVRADLPSTVLSAPFAVGDLPSQVLMSPDGRTAYVENQDNGTITFVDVATNSVTGSVAVGSGSILNSGLSPDGTRLYAGTDFFGVYIIDTGTRAVIGQIPASSTGNLIAGFAFHPFAPCMYITSRDAGVVNTVDLTTNTVVRSWTVTGARMQGLVVSRDGGTLYGTDIQRSKLVSWDLPSGSASYTETNVGTPTSPNAFDVKVTPDNAQLYVSALADGIVFVFDRASRTQIGQITTGGKPRYIGFTPGGSQAVIANESNWVNFVR